MKIVNILLIISLVLVILSLVLIGVYYQLTDSFTGEIIRREEEDKEDEE